jgi:acyl-coenzyme A thioesterase PaaI-like protein
MPEHSFQGRNPSNVCFGCGPANPHGLQIESYWEGEEAVCMWRSHEKYQGWPNVLNGGVLATVIDCHCINTAMAAAVKAEGRELGSEPSYGYATGTITVRYLAPTPNQAVELRATVDEIKGRRIRVRCEVFAQGTKTAEADVVAIRVFDSSRGSPKIGPAAR